MNAEPRPFWPPLVAGIALGLTLLLTFLITGHGLGASGFFARAAAALGGWLAPEATATNAYYGPFLQAGAPLLSWITWEVVGVVIGAFAGSMTARRARVRVERSDGVSSGSRLVYALAGGVLVGFGARLARGCTSGLGLSGGATLAVAGFVFLIGFFAAGFLFSWIFRRAWQ